jgi:hypothetical protein
MEYNIEQIKIDTSFFSNKYDYPSGAGMVEKHLFLDA